MSRFQWMQREMLMMGETNTIEHATRSSSWCPWEELLSCNAFIFVSSAASYLISPPVLSFHFFSWLYFRYWIVETLSCLPASHFFFLFLLDQCATIKETIGNPEISEWNFLWREMTCAAALLAPWISTFFSADVVLHVRPPDVLPPRLWPLQWTPTSDEAAWRTGTAVSLQLVEPKASAPVIQCSFLPQVCDRKS